MSQPKPLRPFRLVIWWVLSMVLVACASQPAPTLVCPTCPPPASAEAIPDPASPAPAEPTGQEDEPADAPEVEPSIESTTPTPEPTRLPATEEPEGEPTEQPLPTPEPTPLGVEPVAHTVQPGESLYKLATTYDVPMVAIQLANDMGVSLSVQAGQILTIPPASEWEDASPFWRLHIVAAGETLGVIATNFGVSVGSIVEVNDLADANLLSVDQQLIIPLENSAGGAAQAAEPTPTPASSPPASTPEAPPVAPPPAQVADWPNIILDLINQFRAEQGLYPLTYNQTLANAAQLHAQDCETRGWCSHTGSDGSSSNDRIIRIGYPAAGTAECWVQSSSPYDGVAWWIDEVPPNDAHRRTLLSSFLTEVGVGIAAADWGYFILADFGRPSE